MKIHLLLLCAFALLLFSCEEAFVANVPPAKDQMVVEGYIEDDLPPFVILSRNSSIYDTFDPASFSALFIHDAEVTVREEGGWEVKLIEYRSDTLPAFFNRLLAQNLGETFVPGTQIYFYTIAREDIHAMGSFDRRYHLSIKTSEGEATATTTIPQGVEIDSIRFEQSPEYDWLYQMLIHINDPDTLGNNYRYFTQVPPAAWYPPLSSVVDDRYFNGQSFWTPLPGGQSPDSTLDNGFGLFPAGELVRLKWCTLDKEHFLFWRSAEFQAVSRANPFSSVVRINGNVQGALGIWGGYGSHEYSAIVR